MYFAFLYNSLSIWNLDFANLLKSLSLVFIFSKTSPSNQFWVFALTLLVLQDAILSTTILIFWKKFQYTSFMSLNSSYFLQGIFISINSVIFKRAKSFMFVNILCFHFINFSCTVDKLIVRYTNINDTMLWNLWGNTS